jgi:hypothetical protein
MKYPNLILCLLVAKQNNKLLIKKNHQLRSIHSEPSLEVNIKISYYCEHDRAWMWT